jgi:hypothetical protein
MRFKRFLSIVCGLAFATTALAQYTYTPPVYTPLQAINSDVMHRGVMDSLRQGEDANSLRAAPAADFSPVYRSSKSQTKKNLNKFVTTTRKTDPDGAAKMEALFASSDVLGQIADAMRSVGLRSDDSSNAYALWWVSAWKASRGDSSTADPATYAAVAEQARRGLANSVAFTEATDAQKQELSEALMVQAALIDGMMEEYASDPKMMKQVASAVKKGALASGIDLDSMTLTPDGFAAGGKRRSDASDAVKDETQALAESNSNPADEGTSNTQLALIAAAGGAGLAGAFLFGKAMGKKG